MPFVKGQIANPTGRPKKTKAQVEFEKKCQEYLEEKGWKAIEKMAEVGDMNTKQWALSKMMDRGFGRPLEVVDATISHESVPSLESITDSITQLISREETEGPGISQPAEGTA